MKRSLLLATIAATAVGTAALAQEQTGADRPNILLIVSDDTGYGDTGAYLGGEARGMPTPNIDRLAREGIRVNVTLVFQPGQALLAARAGATFVSPFVGRLDDVGEDGIGLVEEIVAIFRAQRLSTRVLAASIRHPRHVIAAARVGADIATMPMAVLEQLMRHPLTDAGLARFLADWEAARKGETEAAAARR